MTGSGGTEFRAVTRLAHLAAVLAAVRLVLAVHLQMSLDVGLADKGLPRGMDFGFGWGRGDVTNLRETTVRFIVLIAHAKTNEEGFDGVKRWRDIAGEWARRKPV